MGNYTMLKFQCNYTMLTITQEHHSIKASLLHTQSCFEISMSHSCKLCVPSSKIKLHDLLIKGTHTDNGLRQ